MQRAKCVCLQADKLLVIQLEDRHKEQLAHWSAQNLASGAQAARSERTPGQGAAR